jgi:hypothetical protein
MFVTELVTVLGTAGIAFYVRFLVALCQECKPRRIGHWCVCGSAMAKTRLLNFSSGKNQ